jgi:hypothetical protein
MSREIIEKIKKYFPESGGSGAAPRLATKIKNYFETQKNQKFFEGGCKPSLLKLPKKRKFRHRFLPRTRRF